MMQWSVDVSEVKEKLLAKRKEITDKGLTLAGKKDDPEMWSRKRELEEVVTQIDDALEFLDLGLYGICQRCAAKISQSRLDRVPWVMFCTECQAAQEERQEGSKWR